MEEEQEQAYGQYQSDAKHHLILRECLQKPQALDLEELLKWHKEYKAADGRRMRYNDAIVEKVHSDELDEIVLENCITELGAKVVVTNRFCTACQDLFDTWPDLGDPSIKEPGTGMNWPGSGANWKVTVARSCHSLIMEGAARKGCQFCAFIMQILRDANFLDTMHKIEARLVYLDDKASSSLSVQNWGTNSSQILWINLPGKICNHCNSGIAQTLKFNSSALDNSSNIFNEQQDVLDVTKSWLDICSEHHEDCKRSSQDTLPSRLIYVGADAPQLVLTGEWETKPRYTTLSHSWGDKNFLTLTTETYDSFLERIPYDDLPQSFREAIHITQRLGLEYIWIDSLCIKQGDKEDWRHEAGLMSSVYGNSFLTIAAASAKDAHMGCLLRAPYSVDSLRARITVSGSQYVREFQCDSIYDMSVTRTHLATRAWALQEKLLSPRTIHFGNRGAFWECRALMANDSLPTGFSHKLLGHTLLYKGSMEKYFGSWWADVVRRYSAANLTFASDKLPAISGIARRSYDKRGGQYLAGLWREEHIEAQICWRALEPCKRPLWRAPSWSWASIDGKVSYSTTQPGVLETAYAHFLDAETLPLGEDPFGELRGGWMQMKCSGMLVGQILNGNTVSIRCNGREADSEVADFPVSLDCVDLERDTDASAVYLMPILGGETGAAMRRSPTIEKTKGHVTEDKEEGKYIRELSIMGIVLKSTGVIGEFQRIGRLDFLKNRVHFRNQGDKEGAKEMYDQFLQMFAQDGKVSAEKVCEKTIENLEHPDERFVVRIV